MVSALSRTYIAKDWGTRDKLLLPKTTTGLVPSRIRAGHAPHLCSLSEVTMEIAPPTSWDTLMHRAQCYCSVIAPALLPHPPAAHICSPASRNLAHPKPTPPFLAPCLHPPSSNPSSVLLFAGSHKLPLNSLQAWTKLRASLQPWGEEETCQVLQSTPTPAIH